MSRFRHAFSMSKEDVQNAAPPGTKVLIGIFRIRDSMKALLRLVSTDPRHEEPGESQGRRAEDEVLHLHPAPSQDPRDPLNLPLWRRFLILLLMGLFAFTAVGSCTIISSALPMIVTAFAEHSDHGPPTGLLSFGDLAHLLAVRYP